MARTVADPCMFCGDVHRGNCASDQPAVKPARARKASPPSTRVPPPALVEEPKKVGPVETVAPVETPVLVAAEQSARPNLSSVQRVRDPHMVELGRVLTLFAERDMMHHEDLAKHRDIIDLPDYKVNAQIWRQVNGEAVRSRE